MAKQALPKNLYEEAKQYQRFYREDLTSVGNLTWKSQSSGTTYTSTTGQQGIFDQLVVVLADYIVDPPEESPIGTIRLQAMPLDDPKWVPCDMRPINAVDYPLSDEILSNDPDDPESIWKGFTYAFSGGASGEPPVKYTHFIDGKLIFERQTRTVISYRDILNGGNLMSLNVSNMGLGGTSYNGFTYDGSYYYIVVNKKLYRNPNLSESGWQVMATATFTGYNPTTVQFGNGYYVLGLYPENTGTGSGFRIAYTQNPETAWTIIRTIPAPSGANASAWFSTSPVLFENGRWIVFTGKYAGISEDDTPLNFAEVAGADLLTSLDSVYGIDNKWFIGGTVSDDIGGPYVAVNPSATGIATVCKGNGKYYGIEYAENLITVHVSDDLVAWESYSRSRNSEYNCFFEDVYTESSTTLYKTLAGGRGVFIEEYNMLVILACSARSAAGFEHCFLAGRMAPYIEMSSDFAYVKLK